MALLRDIRRAHQNTNFIKPVACYWIWKILEYLLYGIHHNLSHTTAPKTHIQQQPIEFLHVKRIRRTRILGNFWIVKLLVHFRRIWHFEHVWKTQISIINTQQRAHTNTANPLHDCLCGLDRTGCKRCYPKFMRIYL